MLYLHRINDNRITVPASKCLNALDGIAQQHSASRGAAVALCTMMWACLKDEGIGAAREDEFKKQHWGPAVAAKRATGPFRQTPCLPFRDSFESAWSWSVLGSVLAARSLPSPGSVAHILSATERAESDADAEDGISERDDANVELGKEESQRGAQSDESERDEESDDFLLLDSGTHIPSQLFDKPGLAYKVYKVTSCSPLRVLGRDHRYVALKVCMTGFQGVAREKDALARLASLSLCPYIQKTLDTFMLEGEPGHMHECFVSEALTINLLDSKSILPASVYDLGLFRKVARQVLEAVKFLHTEANMIHGDLRLENFLMRVSSQEYFKHLDAMERQRPSPRKTDGDRIIYERPDYIAVPMDLQCPVLCDYGEARLVNSDTPLLSDIQPFLYRAPEVVLCMPWSYSADVWNIGVMLWELFEDRPLFDACTADGENSSIVHLAEMIGVMGLPPLDFLRRTADPEAIFEHCFDESGRWIGCDAPIHDTPLETLETRLEGKDKAEFLRFMRRILKWIPEERATAAELCEDPWLNVEY